MRGDEVAPVGRQSAPVPIKKTPMEGKGGYSMSPRAQLQLLFHGAVIVFASMLSGIPLAVAIAGDRGAQEVHAWSVTHTSLVSTGILLIAIAAAARHLVLTDSAARLFARTLLFSVFALSIGLVVTALSGQRGLTPQAPLLNTLLYAVNVVGVLGALCAGVLLVWGA